MYWHIGETQMRFENSTLPIVNGSKSALMF
jgi:hypothetical protein